MFCKQSLKISKYKYLVDLVISRISFNSIERDDLYQIGLIALDMSIRAHDESKGTLKTYACKYILFEMRNYLRKKRFTTCPIENEMPDIKNNRENIFIINELNELDSHLREVIVEKYFNNHNQEQIAKKLGFSQSTVSRYEKVALKILKEKLVGNY